jgi:hypothetical protein
MIVGKQNAEKEFVPLTPGSEAIRGDMVKIWRQSVYYPENDSFPENGLNG